MNGEAIVSTIDSLKAIYTVLLALSLGEAFSQLVETNAATRGERIIRKDKIPNLLPFLLLIIPFIQGMDRYFFEVYKTSLRPTSYAGPLLIDCVAFTLEGSLFFVLARSLAWDRWQRFYQTVIILLALDLVWGLIVWQRHLLTVRWWLTLDIGALIPISAMLLSRRGQPKGFWRPSICLIIILGRTIADYILSWTFYFPPS